MTFYFIVSIILIFILIFVGIGMYIYYGNIAHKKRNEVSTYPKVKKQFIQNCNVLMLYADHDKPNKISQNLLYDEYYNERLNADIIFVCFNNETHLVKSRFTETGILKTKK